MKRRWTLWSVLCCTGIPWLCIFLGAGFFLKKQYAFLGIRAGPVGSHGDPVAQLIILFALFAWLYVVARNSMFLASEKKIGLLTWLEPYQYEPRVDSSRKRLAQHPPVDPEYLSQKLDGLVLGRQGNAFVRFPIQKGHALSTIILGTPGSGKSTLILTTLIYQLHKKRGMRKTGSEQLDERQTFFILDCKPELLRKSAYPEDPGIRELSITDRGKWGWDPYYSLDTGACDDEVLTALDILARALIESKGDSKNEFFYESARAIFKFVSLAEYKKGRSFIQTVDYIMDGDLTDIVQRVLERAKNNPELMKVRKGLNAYSAKEKSEAFQSIELTLRQSMEVFQKDSTKFFLDGNRRKLSPLTLESRISIAFTIKTTQIKEYKTILRLVVMQLLHHCENRDEKRSHLITLIIDEAYRLGLINWIDFLSVCRSKQVSCVLAFQSLSQMQSVWSREDADSLLEMVSAIAILSCASTTTANMFCDWAGTYNEEKVSRSMDRCGRKTHSISHEEKKILEPADFMRLRKAKEVILFLDGTYCRVNIERARFYKIPALKRIAEQCEAAYEQIEGKREVTNNEN